MTKVVEIEELEKKVKKTKVSTKPSNITIGDIDDFDNFLYNGKHYKTSNFKRDKIIRISAQGTISFNLDVKYNSKYTYAINRDLIKFGLGASVYPTDNGMHIVLHNSHENIVNLDKPHMVLIEVLG